MYFDETEEEVYDPLFLPLSKLSLSCRSRRFLRILGEVLRFPWLTSKSPKDIESIHLKLMPSFACRCVQINDFLSLQEILKHMDVDAGDYDGNTAIHCACENGNIDIAMQLLSLGATCHLANRFGYTPLCLAIKNKHYDVIKILTQHGATLTQHPVRISMDLVKTVRAKDYRLLHAWYLAGADVNQGDYNGCTALHAAVEIRDELMVSKLLQYGASPEIPDIWERTAADEARKNNLHDILELFNRPILNIPISNSFQSSV